MSIADSIAPAEYRPIPGFPGYRVGDDGSLWSSFIRDSFGQGKMAWKQSLEWRLMRVHCDKRGRKRCELRSENGKPVKRFVHQLVLEAFVGQCPEGMQACHYPDRNPSNCSLENLRWDTTKANAHDRQLHGTQVVGTQVHLAKLSECDVKEIRERRAAGESFVSIASDFNVTPENISAIVHRKTWKYM